MTGNLTELPAGQTGRTRAVAVLMLLAVVGVYCRSFESPLVFDGEKQIVNNTAIRSVGPPFGWLTEHRRPVAYLTFAVNYAVHGLDVRGYHLVNVAIHLAAAVVLYQLLLLTLSCSPATVRYRRHAAGISCAVALLWLVHPLQTQSVTYAIQRIESLMGLLFLLAMWCFARSVFQSASPRWWRAGSLVCCCVAGATKEVAVAAPLVILLYDRAFAAGSWREVFRERGWFHAVQTVLCWSVTAGFVLAHRDAFAGLAGGTAEVSAWEYFRSQPEILLCYLQLVVLPVGQCLDYAWPVAQQPADYVAPMLALVALAGLTLWAMWKYPAVGFPAACFFLVLGPTSSFFPIIDLAFEHRMYLPLAAVLTLLVLASHEVILRFAGGSSVVPRVEMAVAMLAALALGVLAHQRTQDYRSLVTIWADTAGKAPHNPRALRNLGNSLLNEGRFAEAVPPLRQCLELDPNHTLGRLELARCLFETGEPVEGLQQLAEAARRDPDSGPANHRLAVRLEQLGHYDLSQGFFEQAARLQPDEAAVHVDWGVALAGAGDLAGAEEHLQTALELSPDSWEAHTGLGSVIMQRSGDVSRALPHFQAATRLNPDSAEARSNLQRVMALQQ